MGAWKLDFCFKSLSVKAAHKISTETVSQGNVKSLTPRYLHSRESLVYTRQASRDHVCVAHWML